MYEVRATSWDDVIAEAVADKKIYDRLTPEELAAVDDWNSRWHAALRKGGLAEALKIGPNPFNDLRKKYAPLMADSADGIQPSYRGRLRKQ